MTKLELALLLGIGLIIGLMAVLVVAQAVGATYVPKVDVCHYDGESGNFQTLNIAATAALAHLEEHEADYEGACQEVTPTEEPTVTPSEEEVTPTPTAAPDVPFVGDGKGDGRSD